MACSSLPLPFSSVSVSMDPSGKFITFSGKSSPLDTKSMLTGNFLAFMINSYTATEFHVILIITGLVLYWPLLLP